MLFALEYLWTLLCYMVPGILLGMGFALRQNRPARGKRLQEPWEYAREMAPEVALRVGWGLMGASLLAQGMGMLLGLSGVRVLGVCLILDVVALAAFLFLLRTLLQEKFPERV